VPELHTLDDGGQAAEAVAERLIAWLGGASETLDLALYDVRLPGPVGDAVADALRAAMRRGVRVRLAFNDDTPGPDPRPFEPPPPSTERHVLEALGAELKGIPGWRDLMHHKYVVRDREAVWTGSMNWTLDSWTRQENVIATVEDRAVAEAYARDFGQLWDTGRVGASGNFDTPAAGGVQPWFTPGRGRELSHRIAKRIGSARRRVRIATPLVTAAPILAALNEAIAEERVDIAGVCDATQVRQVFRQWAQNPRSRWKGPLLVQALTVFSGKASTPYAPGSLHDFMHAKVTVADDVVFLGSFNLSRSGEMNAENVLEIADPALAERMAHWIDDLRARYPGGI
jgi:phosphatidylserine/phosphatidylglycerophosphate/cardiolipin synthase-like enzyme